MSAKLFLNGRIITAFIMLLVFSTMTIMAFDFPAKARLMPLMFGIPGTIFGLIQLLMEIKHVMAEVPDESPEAVEKASQEKKDEIQMFLWVFLYFIFILGFGFIYASPFLVFGFLFIAKKESLKIAIIGSVCTIIVIYGVFQNWFEIPLFQGLVVEWLTG
ncbi:MAG: tripartite tricarboxylate transporter TctB family protein [Gammaproteobacteria bacterium]|nr:tripartite tricarboxylate transporter TctB family protein [Gammaproteobacteria bacterium]